MPRLQLTVAALVVTLLLPCAARAQNPTSWEFGQDVYAANKGGELGLYFGMAQGNSMVAFRMGILEETQTVPCSLGVMYQHIGFATSQLRIKPTASASVGRVFSCASQGDPRKGSPAVKGTATLAGGVRIGMFTGRHVGGSLDVMGYAERMTGAITPANRLTKGVMVGIAIHGR